MKPWRWSILILSLFACGWSATTYIRKEPKDKPRFWEDLLYPDDPAVEAAWAAYLVSPSFHLLKNLAVEHTRARPQYVVKFLGMVIMFLLAGWALTGLTWWVF